jgi:hypothetical protein
MRRIRKPNLAATYETGVFDDKPKNPPIPQAGRVKERARVIHATREMSFADPMIALRKMILADEE